jgi:hypothetical protein
MEALKNLPDIQRSCVEAEIEGTRGLDGSIYLRAAQHNLRRQLA